MNARLLLTCCSLLAVTAGAQDIPGLNLPAAPRAGPGRKADPFEKTRRQIEALFAHRLAPAKLEAAQYNPFLLGAVGGDPDAGPAAGPVEAYRPVSSDDMVLQQLAAQVKVTGVFQRDDKIQLVIGGQPRGEGAVLTFPFEGASALVRIIRIRPGWIVLGYRSAELQIRY